MEPTVFALRFRGEAVELDRGRFWAETRAAGGLDRLAWLDAVEALCRRELVLSDDGSFVQTGEISFGPDDSITFRAQGELGASPQARLRHGTAVLEVTGGRGRLAGARGLVTSNFLLSDAGDLNDHHFGLLFLERPPEEANHR
jgi:hypothetical protein